ncbi:MFS multidrug transporter, partial [Penicillium antarcticum]|uniref:MFS multidrug transporter n=1 Tax=Penicillium antarcticum TaxID=416450 RepID=UPI0023A517A7
SASEDSANKLSIEHQKVLESQSKLEHKNLSHPLLYDAIPQTVLVDFDGKDGPYRPMNWPFCKKVTTAVLYRFTTCWITFVPAIHASVLVQVSKKIQVSDEVAASGISMLKFGFRLGSLVWAPLSEIYGRKGGGYPIHHWRPVLGSLPFISLLIRIFFAAGVKIYNTKYYFEQFKANGNRPVPEAGLSPMMVGGVSFTLVDIITRFSTSAVASNTFVRPMSESAFPLSIMLMHRDIGVVWGTTIFGCFAALLITVPFLFFF